MAITAIQPITNFSTILPASAIAPRELISVASDFVTTPSASAVVTFGTAEPISQPVFDSSGQLVTPGTFAQTPQSQALADGLASALNSSGSGTSNTNGTPNSSSTSSASFSQLMLEMELINASSLVNANLLNAAVGTGGTTDFSGVLGTQIELAIAGIGTGSGNNAASGALNPNAITAVNTVATAPTTPTTIATTPANVVAPAATVAPATAPAAIAPPATVPPATVPAATAPPATTAPLTTTPTATGTTGTTTTPATTTPITLPGGVATPGSPADVLQRLVADVTGRAAANLLDPGFAATSANLFIGAAVFRASSPTATLGMSTGDTAGNPAAEVTAAQPARAA